MADKSEELDPTQATEARLCAYLEGTLAPADRVEIEKYLGQSPTHRKLLHDLATTRSWLSELPRMSAPVEVAEMFEAAAERTMLLDDSASAASVRINRGPQVMLTAAIVLLALGLGTIIYLVLSTRGPTAQKYASSMKSSSTPTTKPEPGTSAPPMAMPAPAPIAAKGLPSDLMPSLATPASPATMPTKIALAKIATTNQSASIPPAQSLFAQMQSAAVPAGVVPTTASTQAIARGNNYQTINQSIAAGVVRHATTMAADATRPLSVAVGDRLLVDIPQLVGPGVEKTTSVRVDPDGKISLPMLDAMPAAGRTTLELQKQIADRYRQEHLITNPVVSVTVAPATPTTKPASQPTTKPAH